MTYTKEQMQAIVNGHVAVTREKERTRGLVEGALLGLFVAFVGWWLMK